MNQIKNKWTGVVICEGEETIKALAEKNRANLKGAYLKRAYLEGANLKRAYLEDANLERAYLKGAKLERANLKDANLKDANLEGANLKDANLERANLEGAYLKDAKIEFWQFPSIRLLSSINLGSLSDDLTIELFRRDMAAHPKPERFKAWAKDDGPCPYLNEECFWFFDLRKECWKPGKPTMTDCELIFAICKEKGWKISGYKRINNWVAFLVGFAAVALSLPWWLA